jgi:type I restriction enzyme R subunit
VAYDFLSQLVDYDDPELEKLHAFLKMLLPRLQGQDPDPVLIDGAVRLVVYKLVNKREHTLDLEKGETRPLDPLGAGGGDPHADPKAKLSEIIKKIHPLFAGKHSDAEIAGWFTAVVGNAVANEKIVAQAKANATAGQFANGDFKSVLAEAVIKALQSHHSISDQMLQNPKIFDEVAEALLPEIYEQARAAVLDPV